MTDDNGNGRLAGRIALITGASRGIGAAVARRFAAEGARLILAARTEGGLEATDDAVREVGGEALLVPVDLGNHGLVDPLAGSIYERFGRLDIVVGNAAMLGALSPAAHSDPELWQRTLEVNLISNYRLIRACHPLLKLSEAGRAVFVTCGVGRTVTPYWNAYAVSKAGLDMLVRTYAAEVAKTPIRINLVDPGPAATRLRASAFPGEDPGRHPPPDATAITDAFVRLAEASCTENGTLVEVSPQ